MNEVLKNAEFLVRILAVSRTKYVEEWDEDALVKSLKWAKYFEQVYSRIHFKKKHLDQLEKKICSITKEQNLFQGINGFSVHQLICVRKTLIENLLQNRKLPPALFNMLMKEFKTEDGQYSPSSFAMVYKGISKEKLLAWSLLSSLQLFHPTLGDKIPGSQVTKIGADSLPDDSEQLPNWVDVCNCLRYYASGKALKLSIQKQQETANYSHEIKQELRAKLNVLADSLGGQVTIICTIVRRHSQCVSGTSSSNEEALKNEKELKQFIMSYIQEDLVQRWTKEAVKFLQLPPELLCEASQTNKDFFRIYILQLFKSFIGSLARQDAEDLLILIRLTETKDLLDSSKTQDMVGKHLDCLFSYKEIDWLNIGSVFRDMLIDQKNTHDEESIDKWKQFFEKRMTSMGQNRDKILL